MEPLATAFCPTCYRRVLRHHRLMFVTLIVDHFFQQDGNGHIDQNNAIDQVKTHKEEGHTNGLGRIPW